MLSRREFLTYSALSTIIFVLPKQIKAKEENALGAGIPKTNIADSYLSKANEHTHDITVDNFGFPFAFPLSFSKNATSNPQAKSKRIYIPITRKDKIDIVELKK
jgi:hypothetical protein